MPLQCLHIGLLLLSMSSTAWCQSTSNSTTMHTTEPHPWVLPKRYSEPLFPLCSRNVSLDCFLAGPTTMKWESAHSFCRSRGGFLAAKEEQLASIKFFLSTENITKRRGSSSGGTFLTTGHDLIWTALTRVNDHYQWLSQFPAVGQFISWTKSPEMWSEECAALNVTTQRMSLVSCSKLLSFFCFLPKTTFWQGIYDSDEIELRVTSNKEIRQGWVEVPEKNFSQTALTCKAFHKVSGLPLKAQPPVFWSKDGVYLDFHQRQTLFPSTVHDATKSHVPDMSSELPYPQLKQGTFWCESWFPNSSSRLISNKILVTLKEWLVFLLAAQRKEQETSIEDAIGNMQDTLRPSVLNISNYTIDLIKIKKDVDDENNMLTMYKFQVHIPMNDLDIDRLNDLFQDDGRGYRDIFQNNEYLNFSSAVLATYCIEHQTQHSFGNKVVWPFTMSGKVHPVNFRCKISTIELQPGYCRWNYTYGANMEFDIISCEEFNSCPSGYTSIADSYCVSTSISDTWGNGLQHMYKMGSEVSIIDKTEFFQAKENQQSVYELLKGWFIKETKSNFTWLPFKRLVSHGPLQYIGHGNISYLLKEYSQPQFYNTTWMDHHPVSNQDCLALNFQTNQIFTTDCNSNIPAVSLMDVSGLRELPSSDWIDLAPQLIIENQYCPTGWMSTDASAKMVICFKIFVNVGEMSWVKAEEFCEQKGASLPTPGNGFLDWVFRQYLYDENIDTVWMAKSEIQNMDFINWKASTDYSLKYNSFGLNGWLKESNESVKRNILCQKEIKSIKKRGIRLYTANRYGKGRRKQKDPKRICIDLINFSMDFVEEFHCFINGKQIYVKKTKVKSCPFYLDSSQGYFQCQAWIKHPHESVKSNVLLVQKTNVFTFAVTLLERGEYFPEYHDCTFINNQLNNPYTTDCKDSFVEFLQDEMTSMLIAGENFFYSPGLRNTELLHNFNIEIKRKQYNANLISEYDVLVQLSDIFTQERNFSSCELVSIQSTIGCFGEMTPVYGLDMKNLSWPTVQGMKVVLPDELCITDSGEPVTRECKGSFLKGYHWGQISSGCTGRPTNITKSLWSINHSDNQTKDDLKTISNLTADGQSLNAADIHFVATKFQSLSRENTSSEMSLEEVVEALNNVMEANETAFDSVQKKLNTSGILFEAFENITFQIKLPPANGDQEVNATRKLISVERLDLEIDSPVVGYQSAKEGIHEETLKKGFEENSINGDVAIILPENLTRIVATGSGKVAHMQSNINPPKVKLTFAVYRTAKLFKDQKSFPNYSVKGDVIQASYGGKAVSGLEEPVRLLFKHSDKGNDSKCVYWDFKKNQGLGGWSTEGCWKGERKGDYDVCLCNHLTCFARLINYNDEGFEGIHAVVLDIITIIGCSLSIIGLLLVFTTFLLFKKWRRHLSNKILFNLSLSVFCSIVIFLAGINQTWNIILCRSVAVSLHYFILASFGWMLVEAVHQYLKFVKVVGTYIPRFIWKASACAWGVPILPIIIVLVYDNTLYDSKLEDSSEAKICWMSSEGFIYAFLPPLVLTMSVNLIIFILIIYGAIFGRARVNSTLSERSLFMSQLSMAICVFFLLGFTWIFGLLTVWKGRLLFSYLFCIFNTLQGFFIFLLHVFRERTARRSWLDFLSVITKVPVSTSDPGHFNSMQSGGRHLGHVSYNQGGGTLVIPRRASAVTLRSNLTISRASFRPRLDT